MARGVGAGAWGALRPPGGRPLRRRVYDAGPASPLRLLSVTSQMTRPGRVKLRPHGPPPDRDAAEARHVAVLTGAGLSAESGLPTFREALTGLWAKYRPEDLATPEAFERNPALVWDWYRMRREAVLRAEPNAGHLALTRLETLVPRLTLITQNVDGLHRRAGSRDMVEMHGDITRARCSLEGSRGRESWVEPAAGGAPPTCDMCGSYLRPDVVWFGEAVPERALHRAWSGVYDCEVFLAVGTSNLVEPAASLPWLAAAQGAMWRW